MKVGRDIGEIKIIERLRRLFPKGDRTVVGIGDDAAVLPYDARHYLLFTSDAIVDGVDFHLKSSSPEALGWKALCVNLSDIAAMGGKPWAAMVSLGFPRGTDYEVIKGFYAGLKRAARRWNVEIVGGDLSRSRVFFADVTLIGKVEKKYLALRSGARAGDYIFVTGSLGGSILGRHLCFTPRLREARVLAERFRVHAMMDISDGLIQDLGRLLKESGKGACIYLDRIPVARDAFQLAHRRKGNPLRSALCDGEDFELLFTVSPDDGKRLLALRRGLEGTPLSWIGEISAQRKLLFLKERGSGKEVKGRPFGAAVKIRWTGYEHF